MLWLIMRTERYGYLWSQDALTDIYNLVETYWLGSCGILSSRHWVQRTSCIKIFQGTWIARWLPGIRLLFGHVVLRCYVRFNDLPKRTIFPWKQQLWSVSQDCESSRYWGPVRLPRQIRDWAWCTIWWYSRQIPKEELAQFCQCWEPTICH